MGNLAGILLIAASLKGAPETAPLSFSLFNAEKFPGQVLVLRADGGGPAPLPPVEAYGQKAPFYSSSPGGPQFCLIAIPLKAKTGSRTLELGPVNLAYVVKELPGETQVIKLPKKASKALKALSSEKGILETAMEAKGPPLWRGKFLAPAMGRLTTPFGAERLYLPEGNRWRHKGLDWAMEEGRPLHAANDGLVTLARDLKAYGGVVVLSHGYELSSTCMHLSRIRVKEGERVKKGDLIGWSGATGIATGPHLHFQMNLRGLPIDPLEWLEESAASDQFHKKALDANGGPLP